MKRERGATALFLNADYFKTIQKKFSCSTWPFSFKEQKFSAMKNKKNNFRTIFKAVLFSVLVVLVLV